MQKRLVLLLAVVLVIYGCDTGDAKIYERWNEKRGNMKIRIPEIIKKNRLGTF